MNVHAHAHFVAHARTDPTKTTVLRRRFERDLVRRFRTIATLIKEGVRERDALKLNQPMPTFDFPTSPQKVAAFMRWLRRAQAQHILEITEGMPIENAAARAWTNVYVRSAYQKGLSQASSQAQVQGVDISERWIDAGFYRPIHADALGLIYTRTFSDLVGITQAMDTAISRVLAQGMSEGRGMEYMARELVKQVEGVGIVRARMLARTETIRSHATATLNTYKEFGAEGVHLLSEFSSTDDKARCPRCAALEGKVYTMQEAAGVIPVHPNCRCSWKPVIKNPKGLSFQ